MPLEIERKFLVKPKQWKPTVTGIHFCQAYIAITESAAVRIRLEGDNGYLTIKSSEPGKSREEYEYPIPLDDAQQLLRLCPNPPIEKIRYQVKSKGHLWDVDEFKGKNEGLLIAEVELESETEKVILPDWVGQEVTEDERYYNAYLFRFPYTSWGINQ